jgi:hypothetical protein
MYVLELTVRQKYSNSDKNDKKERKLRTSVINNVAPSNFYAPWSVLGSSLKIPSGNYLRVVVDWNQFKQFLLQRTNAKTTGERIRYSKQFVNVLQTGDAQPLLQVTPDKRIHAMKGLASLSRFLGCYDTWLQIRQRYNLKWSTGNENLAAFQRFFDDKRSLDSMLQWVRDAIRVLPAPMGEIIKFNVLTGLRPNEALAAIRLLNIQNSEIGKMNKVQYYNPERQCLEHFRFPEIFLRRTKSAYISIVDNQLLQIAQKVRKTPTYEVLRFRCTRAGLEFHMGWCRKIFGSWLRQNGGIASETVDLLQGRVPRTVFARNYFTPDSSLRQRVLDSLSRLQQTIEES